MKKSKKQSTKKSEKIAIDTNSNNSPAQTELNRGKINDNFLAALVTSKVYKMQVVKAKKGKGSFQRKAKHTGKNLRQESYLIAA